MPFYSYLKSKIKSKDRPRVTKNLLGLMDQLDNLVPPKDTEENLLLATWNIRDFGKPNGWGWGNRLKESYFYIAEIISRFDFVAVQEINELGPWEEVMKILGGKWDYIATDVADIKGGGNGERMAFVFDRRKVSFQHIAGEIVLPPHLLISKSTFEIKGKKVTAGKQFRRTPFIASFQAGWLKFDICTVHIFYGKEYGEGLQERIKEIETIAKYLSKKANSELRKERALILLGDFNIKNPEHETMEALTSNGFTVPDILNGFPATPTGMYYDQIAFKEKKGIINFTNTDNTSPHTRNAGSINVYERLFTEEALHIYESYVKSCKKGKNATTREELLKAFYTWRTHQLSDHFPLWIRINTNNSKQYLTNLSTSSR
ncbi:MAG: endonuclease [Desulfovibrio sp.]|nr:MAG: endonuclease [Desulfovibrio sp.]